MILVAKKLLGACMARHWEWLLIGLLVVGGWGALQKYRLAQARADVAVQQVATVQAEKASVEQALVVEQAASDALVVERERVAGEIRKTTAVLQARERKLHALQSLTNRLQGRLAAIPDDGCLDARVPDAVVRVLQLAASGEADGVASLGALAGAESGAAAVTYGTGLRGDLAGGEPLPAADDGRGPGG